MLCSLSIERIGVIDQALLEFGPGFTALTGETGAGKTMVVTGLSLLMGSRLDSRRAGISSTVEGRVKVHSDTALAAALEELGADLEEQELQVVRRVTKDGRSRAHVGGVPVPVSTLAALVGSEITIHGQSDQLRLKDPIAQLAALDSALEVEAKKLLDDYRAQYREYIGLVREEKQLSSQLRMRRQHEAELRQILEKIATIDTFPHEDTQLKAEIEQLNQAQEAYAAYEGAILALVGDESSSTLTSLDHALNALQPLKSLPEASALISRLIVVRDEVSDLAAETSRHSELSVASPARLQEAQERLYELTQLIREVGPSLDNAKDISTVLSESQKAVEALESLETAASRLAEIEQLKATKMAGLEQLAAELSDARKQRAAELAAQIDTELSNLEMPGAAVKIAINPVELGENGIDSAEFLLKPHPGAEFLPMAHSASGGELSRLMLALEVSIASFMKNSSAETPVFIFDEIDAGIGGRAAKAVGERLAKLANFAQVIVVTHLPQVAAHASVHLLIQKSQQETASGIETKSTVQELNSEARVVELARMLAGDTNSQTALQHASELLESAQTYAKQHA